jgi:hypothetical protein
MMRVSCALVLAAACPLLAAAGSQSRIALADVEIAGPFDGATLDAGAAGRTQITGHLLEGETRIVRVPVPVRAGSLRVPPRIHVAGETGALDAESGRAKFVGWRDDGSADLAWPAVLRARSRPPLEWTAPRPGGAALAVLAAGFVLGLSLLRRPIAALLVSIACAACACAVGVRTDERAAERTTVYEGAADADAWLEVDAERERMVLAASAPAHVESEPADARILCDVALDDADKWTLRAARAVLYRYAPLAPGARSISPAANRWADLAEVWTRDAGEWSARGAWAIGSPLPAAIRGPPPPGWLAAGLPQGTDILVARSRESTDIEPVYLRVSGF